MLRIPNQVKRMMAGADDAATVEMKSAHSQLLNEIRSLRKKNDTESHTDVKSEEWIVRAGDTVRIKLVAKELNTCEIGFYLNNEKVGTYTVENLAECRIYPFADVANAVEVQGDTRVFFDMSSSRFKSAIADEYRFRQGAYVEAESRCDPSRAVARLDESEETQVNFIAPACVMDVSEVGELLVRFEGSGGEFWVEPYSEFIHPCGYRMYLTTSSESQKR